MYYGSRHPPQRDPSGHRRSLSSGRVCIAFPQRDVHIDMHKPSRNSAGRLCRAGGTHCRSDSARRGQPCGRVRNLFSSRAWIGWLQASPQAETIPTAVLRSPFSTEVDMGSCWTTDAYSFRRYTTPGRMRLHALMTVCWVGRYGQRSSALVARFLEIKGSHSTLGSPRQNCSKPMSNHFALAATGKTGQQVSVTWKEHRRHTVAWCMQKSCPRHTAGRETGKFTYTILHRSSTTRKPAPCPARHTRTHTQPGHGFQICPASTGSLGPCASRVR